MTTPVNVSQMPDGSMLARPVYLVDNSGNPISSANGLQTQGGSGGTQYTDGAVAPAHPVGTEIIFNNAGTMTAVSASAGLPTIVQHNNVVSTANSSTSTLTANSVFTGTSESSLNYSAISVEVFADQASAASGLSIQQSQDGTNWDTTDAFTISASTAFSTIVNLVGQNFRIRYTNGGTNQGTFRLQTIKQAAESVMPRSLTASGNLKVAVQEALPAGSALIGSVELVDSAGTNKLAIDASGRLTLIPNSSVNVAQLGGQSPKLDNTNELGVSLYGKQTSAGDTPVLVDSSGRVYVNVNSLPALAAGSANIGGVEIFDSGGTNKLAVDASGRLTLIPNSSVNMAQLAGTTTSTNSGTIDGGTLRTVQGGAATGTKTNVAGSASSVTILASNTSRKGAIIYNDSTAILYLDLSGGTASTSSYSVQIPSNGYFELPPPAIYNGAITGIWSSAVGNARVTEFS